MCGLLTSPRSGLPCGKENSLPDTASCLGPTDTALSSGALHPMGRGRGAGNLLCGLPGAPAGEDALDISVSVRNRGKLASGTTLSPLVSRCHSDTSFLFLQGLSGPGLLFFLSEAPFHRLYRFYSPFSKCEVLKSLCQGWAGPSGSREYTEIREGQCSRHRNRSSHAKCQV